MASFTGTTHDKFVPEQWGDETRDAVESMLVLADSVKKVEHDKRVKGDVIHIPDVSNLTAQDLAESDVDITGQTVTEGEFTLTINKKKHASIYIPKHLGEKLSKYEFRAPYSKKIGYALGKVVDDDLFALWSSLTNAIGTTADALEGNISDALVLRAMELLDENDVPPDDTRVIILPARQKAKALGIDKFVRADSVGDGKQRVVGGRVGELYDFRSVYFTTNSPTKLAATAPATTVDSKVGFAMHKECLALAMPQTVDMDYAYIPQKKAYFLSGDVLYGVAVYRDLFGVVILTKSTG
jgi:hypothetical protein